MKIAYNTFPLNSGHQTRGIGSYTRNLLEGISKIEELEIQQFSNLNEITDADVVHYPYFDLFQQTLPFAKKRPTIVTIHDVIPLEFPKHYPLGIKGNIFLLLQKLSLLNISAIVTDSEASKKSIIKHLDVDGKKIFPIHLAAGSSFKHVDNLKVLLETVNKYNLPQEYILYTGNVNWNKNLPGLTEAALKANTNLVLVGKAFEQKVNLDHPELESYRKFIEKYSLTKRVFILGYIPEEDLINLMNSARAVLLPSFAEGFGLPILEAQACGTPVITSNLSSMAEISDNSALLVNPYNIMEISEAIANIVNNDNLRKVYIKKGLENVKNFSWEKTAQQTASVYKSVILS